MSDISVKVGTQVEATSASSTAVPYPTGLAAGDRLVLVGSVNTTVLSTNPWASGDVLINKAYDNAGTPSVPNLMVVTTLATGSETGSLTVTHGSAASIWQMLAFSSVDSDAYLDVAAVTANQNGDTTLPGLNLQTGHDMLVAVGAISGSSSTALLPTGWTKTMDRSTGTRCATAGYKLATSSGTTGSVLLDWSGTGNGLGILFALRPASPPDPPPTTADLQFITSTAVQEQAASSSTNVTLPTGLQVGDRLFLWGSVNNSALITTPANLTEHYNNAHDSSGTPAAPSLWVASRIVDGTEGASITINHTSNSSIWQCFVFRNVDATTPLDVAVSHIESSSGGSVTLPSLNVITQGAALIYAASVSGSASTASPPSGYIEIGDKSASGTRPGTVGYKLNANSGGTGPVTVAWSGTGLSLGCLIALRPASATPKYIWHTKASGSRVPAIMEMK